MELRAQSGQALVAMLAFIASMVAVLALVLDTGQVANDKIRLLDASDAAVLGAAQWQARALNYQAYLNRAIVANEVAIAQLVSLRAWSDYVATTTANASTVATFIPPIAAAVRALERAWAAIDRAIQSGAPPVEAALSRWNVDVLSTAQTLAHVQAPLAAAALAERIAHDNEPRARLDEASRAMQARNGNAWLNQFTKRYQRGGGDLARLATLLAGARDGFTATRNADLLPQGSPVQVARRGGTDLIGEYGWRGIDTLSAHVDLLLLGGETPLGWGGGQTQARALSGRGTHGGSLRRNPRASRLAQRTLSSRQGYRGLPEIRDVAAPGRRDERSLVYSLSLSLPRETIATVDRLLMPAGLAQVDGSVEHGGPLPAAGALHAIASAAVRFERPTLRQDRREEYPSLFSPYWQARLVAVPRSDQLLAQPGRGLALDPFLEMR